MKTWRFEALDSLFFRGAKPFNSGEGGFLDSQFPPTAQTLAGVMRSSIAETRGVDWHRFHHDQQPDIAALIGKNANDPGALRFAGPRLIKKDVRLYPLPLHLLYSYKSEKWGKLQPAKENDALQTDMGKKRLPDAVEKAEGAKPLENAWLDEAAFEKVLQGEYPESFYREEDLFVAESRTGIGRDNHKRQAEPGLLYFTKHIRLKEGISLVMDVEGADDVMPAKMLRLGGEGRMAHVCVTDTVDSRLRGNDGKGNTAMIVLLTHGDFGGRAEPEFEGIDIVSACTGKAVREGGWDYKRRRPKPLKSLVPAGSVYFVKEKEKDAIAKLDAHIGNRTAFGYGEIAVGKWEDKQ